MDTFRFGSRICLDRRRAAFSGVFDRRTDHRHRDAASAVAPAHRDARDDPSRLVERGCRRRFRDAPEVDSWPERDEADRLAIDVRDQTRRVAAAARQLREYRAAFRLDAALRQRGAHVALLGRREPRVQVPARCAPGTTRHRLHVVDSRRRERTDGQRVFAGAHVARMVTRGAHGRLRPGRTPRILRNPARLKRLSVPMNTAPSLKRRSSGRG